MTVKHLGQDVVFFNTGRFLDVFWGREGWKQHSRSQYKRTKGGFMWEQISGMKMPLYVQRHLDGVM